MQIGTSRPLRFDANAGVTSRGDAGGWAMGQYYEGSLGTNRGGFGAYGAADNLTYLYAGDSWTNPTMIWK